MDSAPRAPVVLVVDDEPNIRELLLDALDVVHGARARDPGRAIELELGERPVRAIGDEHRLHRVITNLVGNAVAHTSSDAAIRVRVDETGETAIVEVHDGPGIDAEHLPQVFDRFYRADAARSRDSGGTGLGLAIAAALVEAHDGRIEAHSRPGRGTTFRALLPLRGPASACPPVFIPFTIGSDELKPFRPQPKQHLGPSITPPPAFLDRGLRIARNCITAASARSTVTRRHSQRSNSGSIRSRGKVRADNPLTGAPGRPRPSSR